MPETEQQIVDRVAAWIGREGGYFGMDEKSTDAMVAEWREQGAQVVAGDG